jgi:hypothetical protein
MICALLLLITIPIGLAIRLLPLGLPWFLYKYLGSLLWAAALYWFLAALLPKLRSRTIAALAITTATLLELTRLIPIAPVDAFRLTFAPERFFSAASSPSKTSSPTSSPLLSLRYLTNT